MDYHQRYCTVTEPTCSIRFDLILGETQPRITAKDNLNLV